jgi:hypothetical protein
MSSFFIIFFKNLYGHCQVAEGDFGMGT